MKILLRTTLVAVMLLNLIWFGGVREAQSSNSQNLSNNSGRSLYGEINQLTTGDLFVSWMDDTGRPAYDFDILSRTSVSRGVSFRVTVNLTNTVADSNCLVVSNSGPYALGFFMDEAGGIARVYYRRSTDAARNWDPSTLVSAPSMPADCPVVTHDRLKALNSKVFANESRDFELNIRGGSGRFVSVGMMQEVGTENRDPVVRTSLDEGVTFAPPITLSNSPTTSVVNMLDLIAQDHRLVAAFVEMSSFSDPKFLLKVSSSSDGGTSFSAPVTPFPDMHVWYPQLGSDGPSLYLTFMCSSPGGQWDICFTKSTNGGMTWGPLINLSNNMNDSLIPRFIAAGPFLRVFWVDVASGPNSDLWMSRSNDGGGTWSPPQKLSNTPGTNYSNFDVVASGPRIHLAWHDATPTDPGEILYRVSGDFGMTWSPIMNISANSTASENPRLLAPGPDVFLVFSNLITGTNYDLFFARDLLQLQGVPFSAAPVAGGENGWDVTRKRCAERSAGHPIYHPALRLCAILFGKSGATGP